MVAANIDVREWIDSVYEIRAMIRPKDICFCKRSVNEMKAIMGAKHVFILSGSHSGKSDC